MDLVEITSYTTEIHRVVETLLCQLSAIPRKIDKAFLEEIIGGKNSNLLFLMCDETIIGMLTMSTHLAPTGRKVWIEDVVVDSAYRGKGYGRQMLLLTIDFAREKGVDALSLTSRPTRGAANALYRSLGFKQKETNYYTMKL